jgi:serine/threonine protein kinase
VVGTHAQHGNRIVKRTLPPGFSRAVLVGKGAFGTVLRARQDDLGRWVALKEIATRDKSVREEAQALAAAPLSCLPTVFGLVVHRRSEWICMEYVHGISLRDAMSQGLDGHEASTLADQLVRAVGVLHGAGRSHGDLKPENVIVEPDGRIRLVDLGFSAKGTESVQAGSVGYLAPERGVVGCDGRRADLWSLGICVHELLVGSRPTPVEASTGWKRLRMAASEWVALVDLLLRDDAARRPASADLLAGELPRVNPLDQRALDRLREQSDRNLASHMVDEAALLLRDGSPSEALWLLQKSLDLDPDQSSALGLLPQVRLDGGVSKRTKWLPVAGLVAVVLGLVIAFAAHREHRRTSSAKVVPIRDPGVGERVRPLQGPRRIETLPLREGRGEQ